MDSIFFYSHPAYLYILFIFSKRCCRHRSISLFIYLSLAAVSIIIFFYLTVPFIISFHLSIAYCSTNNNLSDFLGQEEKEDLFRMRTISINLRKKDFFSKFLFTSFQMWKISLYPMNQFLIQFNSFLGSKQNSLNPVNHS